MSTLWGTGDIRMTWVTIVVLILGLIFLPLFIIWFVSLNKIGRKIDVPPNMPIIEILDQTKLAFTDGYSSGIVKTQRLAKNGNMLIEFYAWDVEQSDISPRPDIVSFVVGKEFIKRSEVGEGSGRRTKIYIIGRNISCYSKVLASTEIGKQLGSEGQLAFLKTTFGDAIISGDEALKKAMTYYARGDVPKFSIEFLEQMIEMMKKMKVESSEEEKKPKP